MKKRHVATLAALFCLLCISLTLAGCGGGGGGGVPAPQSAIKNQDLLTKLVDGTTDAAFTGIGSYLDTQVPFQGAPVLPAAPALDPALRAIILANVNSFLDTGRTPAFTAGSGSFAGVTIDPAGRRITVVSGSTTAAWSFEANKVTRTLTNGTALNSTYVYSSVAGGTRVDIDEQVVEPALSRSCSGSATFQLDPQTGGVTKLLGAVFSQHHSEISGGKTNVVNGTVTMGDEDARPGNLSFDGSYSVYIPGYGQVSGNMSTNGMTYLRGYSQTDQSYYNSNLTNATAISFTSVSDYVAAVPVSNPTWLKGVWAGSFTDGSNGAGMLSMSVTDTAMTWWGQSVDFFGVGVDYKSDGDIELQDGNNLSLWGTGARVSDSSITGHWALNGRSGTFTLTKQQ